MPPIALLYTPENTKHAYQLNWSLTLFHRVLLPPIETWIESLQIATEPDGVRILEARTLNDRSHQFLVSTLPILSPADIVRSIKGRLQYLVRADIPKAFQRNYSIVSVGESNSDCLSNYVANQPSRHPMAAAHTQQRIESFQFLDERLDLSKSRTSSHGHFICNLHIVLENREHLHDTSTRALSSVRDMIVRSCSKKGQLLSRIGLVSNHVHILLGCSVVESPRTVVLSLMNNIAYAFTMKPVLEFSYYVGTFGPYDRGAIRKEITTET
jgi:REP element-mobilizing transposase RayT